MVYRKLTGWQMGRQMGGWMVRCMGGWMGGRTGRWMDRISSHSKGLHPLLGPRSGEHWHFCQRGDRVQKGIFSAKSTAWGPSKGAWGPATGAWEPARGPWGAARGKYCLRLKRVRANVWATIFRPLSPTLCSFTTALCPLVTTAFYSVDKRPNFHRLSTLNQQ